MPSRILKPNSLDENLSRTEKLSILIFTEQDVFVCFIIEDFAVLTGK